MNYMLDAGIVASLANNDLNSAVGCASIKQLIGKKDNNTYTTQQKHSNKSKITTRYKHVKRRRTYNIPEDGKRCIAITKKGEQCICQRLQQANYCVIHNKKYNPKEPTVEEEPKLEKETICRTWKNLYGLLK